MDKPLITIATPRRKKKKKRLKPIDREYPDLYHGGRLFELVEGGMDILEALIQAAREDVERHLSEGKLTKDEAQSVLDWLSKNGKPLIF